MMQWTGNRVPRHSTKTKTEYHIRMMSSLGLLTFLLGQSQPCPPIMKPQLSKMNEPKVNTTTHSIILIRTCTQCACKFRVTDLFNMVQLRYLKNELEMCSVPKASYYSTSSTVFVVQLAGKLPPRVCYDQHYCKVQYCSWLVNSSLFGL